MKVFISWSGPLSKKVAEILKPWIKCVLQATDPFISTEDIDKGKLWFDVITDQLANTGVGIICLTPENIDAPWILFEAGSLAKGLPRNQVCTLLINLSHAELKPPLSQFNGTLPSREDMLKLVSSINGALGDKALESDILKETFEQFWPKFEANLGAVLKEDKPRKHAPQRSQGDMLQEVLETCRSIHRQMQITVERIPERSEIFWRPTTFQAPVQWANLTDVMLNVPEHLRPILYTMPPTQPNPGPKAQTKPEPEPEDKKGDETD